MNRIIVADDPGTGQRILITLFPNGAAEVATRSPRCRRWCAPLEILEDSDAGLSTEQVLDRLRSRIMGIAVEMAAQRDIARANELREELIERQEQAWDELNDQCLPPYRSDVVCLGEASDIGPAA